MTDTVERRDVEALRGYVTPMGKTYEDALRSLAENTSADDRGRLRRLIAVGRVQGGFGDETRGCPISLLRGRDHALADFDHYGPTEVFQAWFSNASIFAIGHLGIEPGVVLKVMLDDVDGRGW